MEQPYLIQRGAFAKRGHKGGIDSILSFDYMGSAEFEFGSLPKSLKRVRKNDNIYFDIELDKDKSVTVYCQLEDKNEVEDYIKQLSKNELRLKEFCDLGSWIKPSEFSTCRNDFWWDIENDFMFWKKDDKFRIKFILNINLY